MFKKNRLLKIGELARKTGITVRTVRYYEELGLIQPVERSEGGFRLYVEGDISRIELVHYLKGMNLPLSKIKKLLLLKKQRSTKGEIIKKIVLPHLESFAKEAHRKIEKYQKIKDEIEKSMSILEECVDCDQFSAAYNCIENCDVIKSKQGYPLVVRLIL